MQLFALIYIILYSLTMVIVSNFVLILKSYATLPILVIYVDFKQFWSFLSIILMVLMMTEFIKVIIYRLKMFYNEDGQKSWKVFKMQKFWGEIWYMLTLLVITFDRKIALMQGLWH